jgi:hypothetical protein
VSRRLGLDSVVVGADDLAAGPGPQLLPDTEGDLARDVDAPAGDRDVEIDEEWKEWKGHALQRQPLPCGLQLYTTLTRLLRSDSDLPAMPGIG